MSIKMCILYLETEFNIKVVYVVADFRNTNRESYIPLFDIMEKLDIGILSMLYVL